MSRKKNPPKPVAPRSASTFEQARSSARAPLTARSAPPTVSGRWLLTAASLAVAAAGVCAWLTLCLLFWQGGWQLLYHPAPVVARTPASVGLAFDPIAFATAETGEPRLKGWWIPAAPGAGYSRYTVLYLHGQNGNLGDAVDDLAALHAVGMNILAFDYRGYGQSQFARPNEAGWREDAEWALHYLTGTRHVAAGTIIVDGSALGANLALDVAAAHPELAGAALESPLDSPLEVIFRDPRARLVPVRLLIGDHYDADKAAANLRVPSLWLIASSGGKKSGGGTESPAEYGHVAAPKMLVWLTPQPTPAPGPALTDQPILRAQPVQDRHFTDAYSRWLDDLPKKPGDV
jgi:hypothetical protein